MIEEAVRLLVSGQVVGTPTDTVYGLAVVPTSEAAVARLYELKGRPEEKPVSLLVSSVEQARRLVRMTPRAADLAARHWPGPLTLVLPALGRLPAWVGDRQRGTVGVRVPDHPLTLRLLDSAGPLAVTSANLSGEPAAMDEEEARAVFGDAIPLYLPGRCPGGTASTVVDATREDLVVLRQGPVQV